MSRSSSSENGRISFMRKSKSGDGSNVTEERKVASLGEIEPDTSNADSATIITASLDDFLNEVPREKYRGSPYAKFSEGFKMPRAFNRVATMGISSVFNSYEQFEDEDNPKNKSMAFTLRFKIKLFTSGEEIQSPDGGKPITTVEYKWGTSTVFIKIERSGVDAPRRTVIFMVDAPDYLVRKVRRAPLKHLLNPFVVFSDMVTDATNRFETSIWELRDVIRAQEKNRPAAKISRPDTALYPHLHDLTRHVIHSTEACDSAIAALEELVHVVKQFIEDYKYEGVNTNIIPCEALTRQAYNSIRNDKVYLQALRNRSQTLYERLKNEINLTFNLVTQFDSSVSVEIGNATRKDSTTMTFIGLLTLFFLPATTVATIYGTNTLPLDEKFNMIKPSNDFWVYWAVTLALTILTGLSWYSYMHFWYKQDIISSILQPETPQKPQQSQEANTYKDEDAEYDDKVFDRRLGSSRIGTFWSQARKRSRATTMEVTGDVEIGDPVRHERGPRIGF